VTLDVTVPLIPIPKPGEEEEEVDDPRVKMPFEIDVDWKRKRERARMLELVVGFGAYFTATYEGVIVLLGMTAGAVGGWFVLRSLIGF